MALWLSPQPLVLASKSDVRGKMLAAVGLRFEIRPAQIDERAVEAKAGTTDAAAVARLLARAKADAVARSLPGRLVLGADQTLARGAKRFSKPANRAAAAEQLRALRGSANRPTAPRRPSSCEPCAGGRTSCIPRWRWCATAPCCSIASTARG